MLQVEELLLVAMLLFQDIRVRWEQLQKLFVPQHLVATLTMLLLGEVMRFTVVRGRLLQLTPALHLGFEMEFRQLEWNLVVV